METAVVLLPEEVKVLADKVPATKQDEVLTVLSQIFKGTDEWEAQVDAIQIKGVDDKMSIALAETARKNAKNARLDGEKIFDKKREEVQARMLDDKLEDALWLKSKQIMQLRFKHIEAKAEEKAKYAIIAEEKRKAELKLFREAELSQYCENVSLFPLGEMTAEAYEQLLNGQKLAHEAKLAAEKAAEEERQRLAKVEKLNAERRNMALPYFQFWSDFEKTLNFGEQSEDDFDNFMERNIKAKEDYEAKQAEIAAENERLRKEAEEKEKALAAERQKAEDEKKAAEAKSQKEREEQEKILEAERAAAAEALRKQQAEAERLAKELSDKKAAEEQAEADRLAKIEAELSMGDAEKMKQLIEDIEALKTKYSFKSKRHNGIYSAVFELLTKVVTFINDKTK